MASNEKFVMAPTTLQRMTRSAWDMNNRFKAPVYHGDLFVIDILDTIPGDGFTYDIDAFIRTATPPIAPFMDDVVLSIAAFYVPERLVFSNMKKFMGEATDGYGIQSAVFKPTTHKNGCVKVSDVVSYPQALGVYLQHIAQNPNVNLAAHTPIGLNPDRAFLQVYNDWFRNENFMDPYLWDHDETGDGARNLATLGGVAVDAYSPLPKVCKKIDRFTSCLPWAQKGNPVSFSLGTQAPVITGDVNQSLVTSDGTLASDVLSLMLSSDKKFTDLPVGADGFNLKAQMGTSALRNGYLYPVGKIDSVNPGSGDATSIAPVNLYADLSSANSITINQLRLSVATQRLLEALARGGSRYRETIFALYNVSIGDTTAQMAEYLGGMTIKLNVDQITQTTGYAAGGTTELGAPGAMSISAASENIFNKSFAEPGYIVLVGYTKHQRTYGQGLKDMYRKTEFLEMYNPKFAFIGEQPISKSTIYFDGDPTNDKAAFGFQEAWSEYRHVPDVCIGALNPSTSNALDFWTLGENFSAAPSLNASFLTEDRAEIARALSGGLSSPDYFVDIKIRRKAVREMPINSIPGYMDHF